MGPPRLLTMKKHQEGPLDSDTRHIQGHGVDRKVYVRPSEVDHCTDELATSEKGEER